MGCWTGGGGVGVGNVEDCEYWTGKAEGFLGRRERRGVELEICKGGWRVMARKTREGRGWKQGKGDERSISLLSLQLEHKPREGRPCERDRTWQEASALDVEGEQAVRDLAGRVLLERVEDVRAGVLGERLVRERRSPSVCYRQRRADERQLVRSREGEEGR